MEKVLEYVSKSLKNTEEQAAFSVYDVNNINPLYGFFKARAALGASESMRSKLAEYNDPRLSRAFITKTRQRERRKSTKPPGTPELMYMHLAEHRNKEPANMVHLCLCIQQQPLLF